MPSIYTQGSPEWLEMRRTKIGASEAAIIQGISPYKTAFDLWSEKTGRTQPPPSNPAMLRGNALEPEVRSYYEEKINETFLPKVVMHPTYEWMMASLDGINFIGNKILEIKCCNREVFEKAQQGIVVPHYYSQIMHQLNCCPEADECHYVCFNRGEYATVIVEPDEDYIEDLIIKEAEFYQCMINNVPPEKGENDYIYIDDPAFSEVEQRYIEAKRQLDTAKAYEAHIKKELLDFTDDGNCEGNDIRMTRYLKQGYDYKKAALDNLDSSKMAEYLKTPVNSWRITIKANK